MPMISSATVESEAQAQWLKRVLQGRFAECGLELHPQKTQIVYCNDDDRRGHYPNEKFDFLGYTFRPRRSKNRWGKYFVNFSPAISNRAAKRMRQAIRDWQPVAGWTSGLTTWLGCSIPSSGVG